MTFYIPADFTADSVLLFTSVCLIIGYALVLRAL